MWQTIITSLVVGVALLFIGKKLYNQIRRAIDPKKNVSCACTGGCSACNTSCDDKSTKMKEFGK